LQLTFIPLPRMKHALLLGAHFATLYATLRVLHPEWVDGPPLGRGPLGGPPQISKQIAKIAAIATAVHFATTQLATRIEK